MSSSPPAVSLEDISVRYRVPTERFGTFKEYMIRRLRGQVNHHEFLALHGVTLSIARGEVFGIVGRNGAGKSTLLKLVARVLKPSSGHLIVRGYVAPLLELGAGFHPELTGRENVFLNGTLLGHSQREIAARFEEVAAFADIGDFIEAPLRTYSTGMVARLGFAVATAWVPDILILDEVLAVGDEPFQRKCFERLRLFREGGATVLFVSHNTAQVRNMCTRAAWLEHGELRALGPTTEAAAAYEAFTGGGVPR
jgi:ABC-2 type transport system ATP-binding protein/lipopolysaccharide transport system ATP-binding protein